jgi:hypothetical protein
MSVFPSFRRRHTLEPGGAIHRVRGHWSRRRILLLLIALSVGWKVLLLGVGGTMVSLLVDDGLASLPQELQPYGVQARELARTLWGGPIERYGVRGIRVVSVERLPGDQAAHCGGLTARVRAYTFFAIPYSEVRTICDRGTVEYRVLPRRIRVN